METKKFGDRVEAIHNDQRRVCPKWADLLMDLMEDLVRLECGLVDMKIEALRRKVYIGCDPARVAAARRKTANRLRWEELDRAISKLERVLNTLEMRLARERSLLARVELPLGIELPGRSAAPFIKENGE